jgi:hypothetical protein
MPPVMAERAELAMTPHLIPTHPMAPPEETAVRVARDWARATAGPAAAEETARTATAATAARAARAVRSAATAVPVVRAATPVPEATVARAARAATVRQV